MKYFLLTITCVVFLFSCGPCPHCDCVNVDDCLSKYKFEEARRYASKSSKSGASFVFAKIIKSEIEYWLNQNDVTRAGGLLAEMSNLETVDKPGDEIAVTWDNGNIKVQDGFTIGTRNTYESELLYEVIKTSVEQNAFELTSRLMNKFPAYNETADDNTNKIKTECFLYVIKEFCQRKEINIAKEKASTFPEKLKINTRYYKIDADAVFGALFTDLEEKAKSIYYEYASECSSKNEEIEPFKGDGKWHKVFKISNLKEDAKEIIADFKKQAK